MNKNPAILRYSEKINDLLERCNFAKNGHLVQRRRQSGKPVMRVATNIDSVLVVQNVSAGYKFCLIPLPDFDEKKEYTPASFATHLRGLADSIDNGVHKAPTVDDTVKSAPAQKLAPDKTPTSKKRRGG